MTTRRTAVSVVAVLTVVALAVTAALTGWWPPGGAGESAAAPRPTGPTTTVTRQTLSTVATASGQLGYGTTTPIVSKQAGTLTWLPAVGTVLSRGSRVLRADEQPVVLLYGSLPMYRALTVGAEGRDVKQFETNLRELGYTGFTVDGSFTTKTAQAVKRWQHELGLPENGVVGIGQVIYAPGALRVAGHLALPGASASGQVISSSGTDRVVTADVPAADAGWAVVGHAVRITLPGGRAVAGTVAEAGAAGAGQTGGGSGGSSDGQSSGGSGGSGSTVHVTIRIADQRALGGLQQGPVGVQYTLDRRPDVLAVPVTALLALAEGGYGLELVDGARSRVVAVETGLVANGQVEVRSAQLRDGQTVGFAR